MRARRALLPLAVAAGVVAILAGAFWSLTARPPLPEAGPGELALPGGVARVDQVLSAARPMMAMPGMGTDQDPVAEGERRVSVEVTLLAVQDDPLRFAVDDFRLEAPGMDPRTPHRAVLPESELPPGTQMSGTLIFDVPVDATAGSLSYEGGGSTEVVLPPETSPEPGGQIHGDDHTDHTQQTADAATATPGSGG